MPHAIIKLTALGLLSLLWVCGAQASIAVNSVRVWPAQEYTRLTLESGRSIRHNMFTLKNPERLVIDLENVELGSKLNDLTRLVGSDGPYIKSVRVARFKPGVVRLVLDLNSEVKPQLFELKPVGEYGYRLVLDVYPAHPVDPLMALLEPSKSNTAEAADTPSVIGLPEASTTGDEQLLSGYPQAERQIDQSVTIDNSTQRTVAPPIVPPGVPPGVLPVVPATAPNLPELRARTLIIAIDAGHGGEDPGARGRHGSLEKNVTLAIARNVKALVDATPNMRGLLVRDGDYFIPLFGRVAKARKVNADLFISIHADAFVKPTVRGSSVFALSEHGATSASARWLAKKENEADLIGGVNIAVKDVHLARTLLDLSQTAAINDSMKLAKHVLNELGGINDLHVGHVQQAGFAVLKSPDIPSILVETAFISNPSEERRLNDKNYQMKLAHAIMAGIKRYFAQNPALSKPKIAQAEF